MTLKELITYLKKNSPKHIHVKETFTQNEEIKHKEYDLQRISRETS